MKKLFVVGALVAFVLFLSGCAKKDSDTNVGVQQRSSDNSNSTPLETTSPTNDSVNSVTNGILNDDKFIEITAQMKCLESVTLQPADVEKFFNSFGVSSETYYRYYAEAVKRPDVIQLFTAVSTKYDAIDSADQCYRTK